ncbi:retrovirus-related pol polyprotein from transposon TNT 1-94 [Tanacetum coccineum]
MDQSVGLRMFGSDTIKLDRMDGMNFTHWKEKIKFMLTVFKVYYVLEGPPVDVRTEEEQRKREQDETLCRGYILRKNNKGNDKKRKGTWNSSKDNKKDKKPLSEVVCYKCGEKEHIKRYCKNPKKKNQNSNKKYESTNAVEQVDTTEITTMVSEMNIRNDFRN